MMDSDQLGVLEDPHSPPGQSEGTNQRMSEQVNQRLRVYKCSLMKTINCLLLNHMGWSYRHPFLLHQEDKNDPSLCLKKV